MKTTINLYDFREAFRRAERENSFSYEGLEVLFNGLEEYEQDTGEEIELDVIALCCDFRESTEEEILYDYSHMMTTEGEQDLEEWLSNHTWYIGKTKENTFVFREF